MKALVLILVIKEMFSILTTLLILLKLNSAADPGVVETNIMREVPSHLSVLSIVVLRTLGLLQSPDNGVESIIDASLAPPVSLIGLHF